MDAAIFSAGQAKNVDIAQAMARLFNAARRKKSKYRFTNLGLENYKYGEGCGGYRENRVIGGLWDRNQHYY